MRVVERILKLREKMGEHGIDFYIVPTADFHQSEYVGDHFKCVYYRFYWFSRNCSHYNQRSTFVDRWKILCAGSRPVERQHSRINENGRTRSSHIIRVSEK